MRALIVVLPVIAVKNYDISAGLNNLVTFQYSLNIFKQYMYLTT